MDWLLHWFSNSKEQDSGNFQNPEQNGRVLKKEPACLSKSLLGRQTDTECYRKLIVPWWRHRTGSKFCFTATNIGQGLSYLQRSGGQQFSGKDQRCSRLLCTLGKQHDTTKRPYLAAPNSYPALFFHSSYHHMASLCLTHAHVFLSPPIRMEALWEQQCCFVHASIPRINISAWHIIATQ